jgi:hypothetical protein
MSYSPTKPDAGKSPLIDVVQIKNDFSAWNTVFSTIIAGLTYNHTAMNSPNQGNHESVIMQLQASDPGVTQDLAVLYCKNAASFVGTQPQLVVQIPKFLPNQNDATNAPNQDMQLSYNSVNIAGPVYQSFLQCGYLIYFGSTSDITVNIVLSPAPTKILTAIATPNNLTTVGTPIPFFASTTILSNTSFRINSNATGAYSFGWIAIASA